jgi:two-component system sensor histidine kinase/response regulator
VREGAGVEAPLFRLDAVLAEVLQALGTALETPALAEPEGAPAAGKEAARAVVEKLAAFLADSDGETADYLAEHAHTLRAALGHERFAEIRKAVDGYDFETALEKLRATSGAT